MILFKFFYVFLILSFINYLHSQELDASSIIGSQDISGAIQQIQENQNMLYRNESSIDTNSEKEESLEKIINTNDSNLSEGKKYGYDFFSSMPTSIFAGGDLPIPNDYKLSLNDQITVILSGSRNLKFDLIVRLDGSILFPEIGSVNVVGKTLGEVKSILTSLVSQAYIGVNLSVAMKNLSAKKITIVGAVKTPGTYLVNPFSTITNALAYSGGISEIGTLRNIKLIRTNKEVFYFDLYKLLIFGDRSEDITIEAGDVIIIEPANQFINLKGKVVRPAIYEIKSNESLEDLVKFGLGFVNVANRSNIQMSVLDIVENSIVNKTTSDLSSSLKNVTDVEIYPYINKTLPIVKINGAIKEPGIYKLRSKNETLASLIKRLEFVDVYPWLAVLEQFDDDNLIKSSFLFNLNDPETYNTIKLLPNSRIFFANLNSRTYQVDTITETKISDFELSINHKQGTFKFPVIGKFSVQSFIDLLGLDMSDVDVEATYISPLEDKVLVEDYRKMKFTAKKYNTVSFRSPVNDLISVNISGAIEYPGTYTLQSNSTLQELYEIVGNFKPEAFKEGIIFSRESIRERQLLAIEKSRKDLNEALLVSQQKGLNIGDINVIQALSENINPYNLGRIAGDYAPNSKSSKNTILLNGDSIQIPKNPNVINVLGEVLNPIAFEFSKRISVSSAISSAGGFKDYADKSKIYVIKANGIVKRSKRNIITKVITFGIFPRQPKLEPGDTIVVPRKIITNNPGIDALIPITQILSDLAFSAAAIESLRD